MILELLAGVGVVGVAVSLARAFADRIGARTLTDLELQHRELDRAIGVRDGDRLDVWVPIGARVPVKVNHFLRGVPESGRGLRLSLYDSPPGDPRQASRRLVRTWLGPFPDGSGPVLVEVTLGVDRAGRLRLHGVDQSDGRRLEITKDDRGAAPETVVSTREALGGE